MYLTYLVRVMMVLMRVVMDEVIPKTSAIVGGESYMLRTGSLKVGALPASSRGKVVEFHKRRYLVK